MLQKDRECSSIECKCLWVVDTKVGRAQIEREGAKGCRGPMWRWREDLSRFTKMEKRLHAHNTSRLATGDQGNERECWYGSLWSE